MQYSQRRYKNTGIFDRLFRPSSSKSSIDLQRSLEGIQLGTTVELFESDSAWQEIVEPEKAMFESGLLGEKLFMMSSGDKQFVCGFVFDKLYKVGITAPASDTDFYLKQFTDKYGRPIKPEFGCYMWENDNIGLELIKGEAQLNIFLTDKNLLKKASGV